MLRNDGNQSHQLKRFALQMTGICMFRLYLTGSYSSMVEHDPPLWTSVCMEWMKELNVLFNDTLNTFYLRLYGVRHMVKDHSDSEKGNPLPPHGLLFPINSKGSFICTIPDRIAHTTAFVTPVMEHWLGREIAQWVHPMEDRSNDPSHHEQTLLPRSYISLPYAWMSIISVNEKLCLSWCHIHFTLLHKISII